MMKVLASFFGGLMALVVVAGEGHTAEIGKHGDWTVFRSDSGENACYLGSVPTRDEGDYTRRGDIYVLVTHWPASGKLDVVSVEAGYDYKSGSDVTVRIGAQSFKMFTHKGNAWAETEALDKQLVQAMKKGATMVVTGFSWRGTKTTDTYSLAGFTAAYNAARKACGL